MAKDFNNLDDLFKHINDQIEDIMKHEVLETVKDTMQEKIQTVVYDAYTPEKEYPWKRRYSNGGLMDRDNIRIASYDKLNDEQVMFIKNFTGGNPLAENTDGTDAPNFLAGIIEFGRYERGGGSAGMYTKNSSNTHWNYLRPRPFVYHTYLELSRTLKHVESLKIGLKKRGVNTE